MPPSAEIQAVQRRDYVLRHQWASEEQREERLATYRNPETIQKTIESMLVTKTKSVHRKELVRITFGYPCGEWRSLNRGAAAGGEHTLPRRAGECAGPSLLRLRPQVKNEW